MHYKIVMVVDDEEPALLVSAWVTGAAEVEYLPGLWVAAPDWLDHHGYGLCCFESLATAVEYYRHLTHVSRYQIWECETQEILDLAPACDASALANGYLQPRFTEFYLHMSHWPAGTIMARQVKLTRRVNPEELATLIPVKEDHE